MTFLNEPIEESVVLLGKGSMPIAALALSVSLASAGATAAPAASAAEVQPLLIGATAPTPVLQTVDGGEFDLAAAFAKKPTLLILYRGGW